MQPNLSHTPPGPRQSPWRTREPAKLWLEQEDPVEIKRIEEQKKRQKALEKELSEKRKKQKEKQKEQKEQASLAH